MSTKSTSLLADLLPQLEKLSIGQIHTRSPRTKVPTKRVKPSTKAHLVRFTQKSKVRMRQLIEGLREDVIKVSEPKAQALFETSAEVITGLLKAFGDYEKASEVAWRLSPITIHSKERHSNASRR
jgi:hypothetical protein